jgi:hypothetical protein
MPNKKGGRISANYIRKYFPSLRRVSTPEGRRWTLDGQTFLVSLQDVITSIRGEIKKAELAMAEVNANSEKGADDVQSN